MHIAGHNELMSVVNDYVASTLAITIANHQARPLALLREPQDTSGDCAMIMQATSVADAFGEALIHLTKGLETQEVTIPHG